MIIAGIILAAGFSRRMQGLNKLLLEINGKLMIEHVIENCLESSLDDLILVYKDNELKEICNKYNIRSVYNGDSEKGQSTSLIAGINALSGETDACVFILGDMPFVNKEVIDGLISNYKENKGTIAVPLYKGKRGNPVLFDKKYYNEIRNLRGDEGARSIILNNIKEAAIINVNNDKQNIDIDCLEDLKKTDLS